MIFTRALRSVHILREVLRSSVGIANTPGTRLQN